MTDITYNQVYAVGVPIVLLLILVEVLASNWNKKSYYTKGDTLCTVGLLLATLQWFMLSGITLALHFYVFQYSFSTYFRDSSVD